MNFRSMFNGDNLITYLFVNRLFLHAIYAPIARHPRACVSLINFCFTQSTLNAINYHVDNEVFNNDLLPNFFIAAQFYSIKLVDLFSNHVRFTNFKS